MEDFRGRTIEVGAEVIAVRPNYRSGGHLVEGTVTRLTAKMAEVEYPYSNRWSEGKTAKALLKPSSIVVI